MSDVSPPLKIVLLRGMSCGLGWCWFHHEATITRGVPVDSVGTGSITRRPLHGVFLWTRLVLVPSRGDHYTGCSCGLGWCWFHHEATITRGVPVDSVGAGYTGCSCGLGWYWFHHEATITRGVPVDSVGLVPSRGDHYTGCSCGLGWYWFHHEATITRDVPVDSVGTGSITRRPLHGMFLWTPGSITRRPLHGMFLWTGWYWFHHEATICIVPSLATFS